jgi:AcrR family transcriptional regulator
MALILQTAEALMLREGYAAVTVRSVAKVAGLSSTLLHYYFPTLDDLLVALYRYSTERDFQLLERALSSGNPITLLWEYQTDTTRTALAAEYLALANHRKEIRVEIKKAAEKARIMQMKFLAETLDASGSSSAHCTPVCISMLLTSVSRNLILESGVGISLGHAEARAYVERELAMLTKPKKTRA